MPPPYGSRRTQGVATQPRRCGRFVSEGKQRKKMRTLSGGSSGPEWRRSRKRSTWTRSLTTTRSPRRPRKTLGSLILAIGPQGVLHYHILNGSCKKTNFVDFMNDLPAELVDQKTLVMDNIMFHHSVETLDAAKRKNCKILHIPPYSPRYNAIEYAFSILKRNYRSVCSEADLQTAVADDYLHALTASIEMCGSFEGLFRRVRQSVDAYRRRIRRWGRMKTVGRRR